MSRHGFAAPAIIFVSVTMKSVRWMLSEWLFIWWRFDPTHANTDDDFQKLAPFWSDMSPFLRKVVSWKQLL